MSMEEIRTAITIEEIQTAITICAFLLSALALIFTRRTWFESNRPIVTAEIVTHSAGNVSITYNLVVHNTGTRPATDIKLLANSSDVESAINKESSEGMQRN